MSNSRPPGESGPTHDPGLEREHGANPASPAPQPWVDPNRTKVYSRQRRSIADRLHDDDPPEQTKVPTKDTAPPPPPRPQPRAPVAPSERQRRGPRLWILLLGVVVAGLATGAAAAWFSGWRPAFLTPAAPEEPVPPPAEKPPETPVETKPKPPEAPPKPPPVEIARICYAAITEVKAGASACGFALDASGAVRFQGDVIAERLTAGSGPAQRLSLYPFSPSGRFVFLRACESASGGRCLTQRLVDTKEKKIFELRAGADGFNWVGFSPKEQVGLLAYRDRASDALAAINTADGQSLEASAIKTPRNRYALIKLATLRWPAEQSFSIEVKICPLQRGQARNRDCEQDDDIPYRRRTVKLNK